MAQIRFLRISTSQPSQFPNNNVSTIMSLKNLRSERATWRRGGGESLLWWAIFISRQFSIEICSSVADTWPHYLTTSTYFINIVICPYFHPSEAVYNVQTESYFCNRSSWMHVTGLGGGKLCCKQLGNIKIFFTLRQNADSHAELRQHLYLTRNRKPHSWSRQRYTTLN